ncbi:hypothetical protein [Streptomyces viridochromogenes]|uniref:Uncharacterized protein n=1 Tax=Streptomyces viridochromogenes Tue57 TaxID=1160705 RepID=L8PQE9_STRVR|nr:hypothetical protein [Streptomyces viridochromogenes]ELS58238.1 hypothetical protein STVIR_0789 [Streptomyces viridochromogenes Tue57]
MNRTWTKPVVATLVAATASLAYWGYGTLHAQDLLTDDIRSQSAHLDVVNIRVELGFKAETFNREFLSQFGSPGAGTDTAVMVFNVRPADLETIARQYWVKSIQLL